MINVALNKMEGKFSLEVLRWEPNLGSAQGGEKAAPWRKDTGEFVTAPNLFPEAITSGGHLIREPVLLAHFELVLNNHGDVSLDGNAIPWKLGGEGTLYSAASTESILPQ